MSSVQKLEVNEADDGQRLDRWLKKYVPELPWVLAQKLIRKGAIRVDGKRADTDTRLSTGQEIRIPPIEDRADRAKPEKKAITSSDRSYMKSLVIYDDGDVVAINKPGDIATQGGGGVERHIDGLLEALENKDGLKPRLVHRLDRDTSGVLLFARSAEAVRGLGKAFMGRRVKKIYWALTTPAPQQNDGLIRAPLAKSKGQFKDRMVVSEDEDSQTALTDFVVLERAGKRAAFVAFSPRTGRTHQIRVHAADVLNCPIIGDNKYGGADAMMRDTELTDRLNLHARRIVIPHPTQKNKMLDITAPLPDDLIQNWRTLGFDDAAAPDDPFGDVDKS
jgi:23S rRNA pseudouridine955/2504/2580 synthase